MRTVLVRGAADRSPLGLWDETLERFRITVDSGGALGRDGEGGALAEAELRAHLVLEIPVDLGHVWSDLAPAERAGYSAGAASS